MEYNVGSKVFFRGSNLTRVEVSKIRQTPLLELAQRRLLMLEHGFDPLEKIMNDPNWDNNRLDGEPITLQLEGFEYTVSGRKASRFSSPKIWLLGCMGFNSERVIEVGQPA